MPNPYDDILHDAGEAEKPTPSPPSLNEPEPIDLNDPRFLHEGPEALDEILDAVAEFNQKAEDFSRLLSEMSVADHQVAGKVSRLFLVQDDPHERGNLGGERAYHELQEQKFRLIIAPMRQLAELHLATVQRFNNDIDKHYYSLEKTDRTVAAEKKAAMEGINLQRRILADATDSLQTLEAGLADTERRIKTYIHAGGGNNISRAEYDLLVRKREELTSGREHQFNYAFFDVNLLDKTALSLGIYLKETTAQYLGSLGKIFLG